MKKIIYMHKFPDGMIYIGQTNNSKVRWSTGKAYEQKAMREAIQKWGWENVQHIILEDNVDEWEADEKENYYIGKYQSYKNGTGYNTIYNNKAYPKYKKNKNKEKKKTMNVCIKLQEEEYDYFLKKASKHNMNVQKYIYIKLIEEKTNIKLLD